MTHEDYHGIAVKATFESKQILIHYAPGTGKSRISLMILEREFMSNPNAKILIVCSSKNARDVEWPAQFEVWNYEDYLTKVRFVIYTELGNIIFDNYTLVIADEIHKITPRSFSFFYKNTISRLVLLTGTIPDNEEKSKMIASLHKGNIVTLPLEEAIENTIINPFHVYVISVKMYKSEWEPYVEACRLLTHADKIPKDIRIRRRMQNIYNFKGKRDVAIWLLDNLTKAGNRTLVYCSTKEQANAVSPWRYHSDTTPADFLRFKEKDGIPSLAVVGMISDNANIPNLNRGIIIQIKRDSADIIQKIGRFLRNVNKHEISKLYILSALKTQDEVWVYKALQKIDPNRITYIPWDKLIEMGYQPNEETI